MNDKTIAGIPGYILGELILNNIPLISDISSFEYLEPIINNLDVSCIVEESKKEEVLANLSNIIALVFRRESPDNCITDESYIKLLGYYLLLKLGGENSCDNIKHIIRLMLANGKDEDNARLLNVFIEFLVEDEETEEGSSTSANALFSADKSLKSNFVKFLLEAFECNSGRFIPLSFIGVTNFTDSSIKLDDNKKKSKKVKDLGDSEINSILEGLNRWVYHVFDSGVIQADETGENDDDKEEKGDVEEEGAKDIDEGEGHVAEDKDEEMEQLFFMDTSALPVPAEGAVASDDGEGEKEEEFITASPVKKGKGKTPSKRKNSVSESETEGTRKSTRKRSV